MIPRYSRPEMTKIWEAENKFRIWFEIEAHACDALADSWKAMRTILRVALRDGLLEEDSIRVALALADKVQP